MALTKPKNPPFSLNDLVDTLFDSDKDLFIKFRDHQITFDQLKARIAERHFKVSYVVLDDLKDKLDPSFYQDLDSFEPYFKMIYSNNPTYKDILRKLEPYESNNRCLRSIKHIPKKERTKKQSHFFRSISRD